MSIERDIVDNVLIVNIDREDIDLADEYNKYSVYDKFANLFENFYRLLSINNSDVIQTFWKEFLNLLKPILKDTINNINIDNNISVETILKTLSTNYSLNDNTKKYLRKDLTL